MPRMTDAEIQAAMPEGEQIRAAREARGLTKRQLSKDAGWTGSTHYVSWVENPNIAKCSDFTLDRYYRSLCTALDIEPITRDVDDTPFNDERAASNPDERSTRAQTPIRITRTHAPLGYGDYLVYAWHYPGYKSRQPFPIKIGRTKDTLEKRLSGNSTDMPEQPVLCFELSLKTEREASRLEQVLMDALTPHTDCPGQEWFLTTPQEIHRVFKKYNALSRVDYASTDPR